MNRFFKAPVKCNNTLFVWLVFPAVCLNGFLLAINNKNTLVKKRHFPDTQKLLWSQSTLSY